MKDVNEFLIPEHLEDLTKKQRGTLFEWIDTCLVMTKNICYTRTAYGLKHIFKADCGIYITTGVFREAMEEMGYREAKVSKENWSFNISSKIREWKG